MAGRYLFLPLKPPYLLLEAASLELGLAGKVSCGRDTRGLVWKFSSSWRAAPNMSWAGREGAGKEKLGCLSPKIGCSWRGLGCCPKFRCCPKPWDWRWSWSWLCPGKSMELKLSWLSGCLNWPKPSCCCWTPYPGFSCNGAKLAKLCGGAMPSNGWGGGKRGTWEQETVLIYHEQSWFSQMQSFQQFLALIWQKKITYALEQEKALKIQSISVTQ